MGLTSTAGRGTLSDLEVTAGKWENWGTPDREEMKEMKEMDHRSSPANIISTGAANTEVG